MSPLVRLVPLAAVFAIALASAPRHAVAQEQPPAVDAFAESATDHAQLDRLESLRQTQLLLGYGVAVGSALTYGLWYYSGGPDLEREPEASPPPGADAAETLMWGVGGLTAVTALGALAYPGLIDAELNGGPSWREAPSAISAAATLTGTYLVLTAEGEYDERRATGWALVMTGAIAAGIQVGINQPRLRLALGAERPIHHWSAVAPYVLAASSAAIALGAARLSLARDEDSSVGLDGSGYGPAVITAGTVLWVPSALYLLVSPTERGGAIIHRGGRMSLVPTGVAVASGIFGLVLVQQQELFSDHEEVGVLAASGAFAVAVAAVGYQARLNMQAAPMPRPEPEDRAQLQASIAPWISGDTLGLGVAGTF